MKARKGKQGWKQKTSKLVPVKTNPNFEHLITLQILYPPLEDFQQRSLSTRYQSPTQARMNPMAMAMMSAAQGAAGTTLKMDGYKNPPLGPKLKLTDYD